MCDKETEPRAPLTDDELRAMTEHIAYEVARLYMPLRVPVPTHADPRVFAWLKQCVLESAVTHLRNVAEFLVMPVPRKDSYNETTVVAPDYLYPWPGKPGYLFGTKLGHHKAVINEINWRVSHISTQRAAPRKGAPFQWTEVTSQIPHVLETWDGFLVDLRAVHPDRADWFDEEIAKAKMAIDELSTEDFVKLMDD